MNVATLPRKLADHYERGGAWALAYLVTSKLPRLPLPRKIQWLLGRAHEIEFWDRYFATKGLYWPEEFKARFDGQRPLDPYVAEVAARLPDARLRVLDVGAGPLTSLSDGLPGKKLDIVPVDPLARDYERILQKHAMTPPVRTQFAEAEKLSATFAPNSFDLVHARNSIDHSYDPVAAVREMLAVARPGGFVVLQHVPNEAINENWVGLHQWNFSKQGDDFVIEGRDSRTNVTAAFAQTAQVTTSLHDQDKWLVVRLHKHA